MSQDGNPEDVIPAGEIPPDLAATIRDLLARGTDPAHLRRLLDAFQLHREWEHEFERALSEPDPGDKLRDSVSFLIAGGAGRDQVRCRLEAFHLQLVSQDRDEDDDLVLDVLDSLTDF